MDPGEQTTGTRDEHYNLISVLYHALHGAETIEEYILDAEAAGDERLADFFREAQAMQRQLAERAKAMLGILEVPPETASVPPETSEGLPPITPPEGGVPPGAPPREAVPSEPVLPEEDIIMPEETPPGDVPRGTSPDPPPRTGEVSPGPSEPPPTGAPSGAPREAPPPGEERPERRGTAPSTDTPREAPPPGEERPEKRTP